jgi:outer membrane protein assembly factor BamB
VEAWRANVSTGFSSFAISQGRLFTIGNSNATDIIWCLDARTGRKLWSHSYPAKLDPQYYEGGPTSTPSVADGRVYTLSKWGSAFCLNATNGAVIWRHDFWQEGIRSNRWGFAGSPLIWQDLVIYNAGDAGTALKLSDGSLAWSTGTNVAGYATPMVVRLAGRETALIFAKDFLVALDPATGREFWRYPFKTSYDTNNTDPLVEEDTILLSSFSRGCELIRVDPAGPHRIYANKNLNIHLSPGVFLGGFLYAFHGEAKFTTDLRCIEVKTGSVRWSVKDPAFGSLLGVPGGLLALTEKGELLAMEVTPEGCRVLGRTKVLTGLCWTPPALADGLFYGRNASGDLVALDLR